MSNKSTLLKKKPCSPDNSILYVGNLTLDVTGMDLEQLFNTYGELSSVRLVVHPECDTPNVNHAYLNFVEATCAMEAMKNLNNCFFKGQYLRIMFNFRNPFRRKNSQNNIYIRKLDKSIDQKTLFQKFSDFGPIMSCKIPCDENGISLGYAYVHFNKKKDAKKAILALNKTALTKDGMSMEVMEFIPRYTRNQIFQIRNLFVKNFPTDWDQEDLSKEFSSFGEIKSCIILNNTNCNIYDSKKYGFVCYKESNHAQIALNALHNKNIESSDKKIYKLYVSIALNKKDRANQLADEKENKKLNLNIKNNDKNLYIKYLDDKVDDAQLKSLFSKYGSITSVKVMRHENGISKGFGFVCFSEKSEASAALTSMKGVKVFSKPLYIALSQNKNERKAAQNEINKSRQFPNSNNYYIPEQYLVPANPNEVPKDYVTNMMYAQMQYHNAFLSQSNIPGIINSHQNSNTMYQIRTYFEKKGAFMFNMYINASKAKRNGIVGEFICEFLKTFYYFKDTTRIARLSQSIIKESSHSENKNFFILTNGSLVSKIGSHINIVM
ncbi:zDazl [Intoshia linei]|uniref:ZDazl n=1 Tax=Intoshia linei TaxID=1819745 RepID=A0A177B354_9BILA|nr:zDazl [Intoshia linei]